MLVKVLRVAPGAASRASSANSSAVHISGVSGRCETVQEPGVDLPVQLRQLLQGIADQQGQRHSSIGEDQALETLMDRHVLRKQLLGLKVELWPQGQRPAQVLGAQGVLFDADKMQPRPNGGALLEQLPGAEKIQAGAKPGFADHQPPVIGQRSETLGQVVLLKKHITGFVQARLVGKIHIVEHPRARAPLVVPVE